MNPPLQHWMLSWLAALLLWPSITLAMQLTPDEQAWLQANPELRVGVEQSWPPFDFVNATGEVSGITIDYLQRVADRLGVTLRFDYQRDWAAKLDALRDGELDLMGSMVRTTEREAYLRFSPVYFRSPYVIVTRDDDPVSDIDALEGDVIAIERGYATVGQLRDDYFELQLLELADTRMALEAVASGRARAYIGHRPVIAHFLREAMLSNLSISALAPLPASELRIGVRRDLPVLAELISRAIADQLALINAHVLTSSCNAKGQLTEVSDALCEKLGRSRKSLIGRHHQALLAPHDQGMIVEIDRALNNHEAWHGELLHHCAHGEARCMDTTVVPRLHHGRLEGFTTTRHDVTDSKRVERLSITDELTGLFNRRHFNEVFMDSRSEASDRRQYFAFIILDVDHFKRYNDIYGHVPGDQALAKLGHALRAELRRSGDMAFRLGGEEMACLVSADSHSGAVDVAEHIRQAVENLAIPHAGNDHAFLTVSVGIRILDPDEPANKTSLYAQADAALYAAKQAGRNCVAVSEERDQG